MKTTTASTAKERGKWLVEVTTDHPGKFGGYAETAIFECSTEALAESLTSFIRDNDVHVWNVIDSAYLERNDMETFTQPKITGYRQLNEAEAQLMNAFKSDLGSYLVTAVSMAMQHVGAQRAAALGVIRERDGEMPPYSDEGRAARAEIMRLDAAQPERWIAIANTHFQEGLMALTRAVAQPGSF